MSAIRSFVTVKPFKSTTTVGTNMNGLRKSVNRLGQTTEGIGKSIEQMAIITEFQKDYIVGKVKTDRKYDVGKDKEKKLIASRLKVQKKREKLRGKRDKSADMSKNLEKGKEIAKEKENRKKELTPFQKMLDRIGGFFSSIFSAFLLFGGLDWMSKNGEAIKQVFKVVASLVKFVYKITSFGVNNVLNGLTNMFGRTDNLGENKINRVFRFFKGGMQLLVGLAALRGAQYLLMPWKLFSDVGKLTNIFEGARKTEQGAKEATERVKNGYYDKKTNKFYTKEEYNTMRKAARKQPGGLKAFENRVRPTSKIGGMKMGATRRMGNAFKGLKGRIPGGGATMLAGATSVVGGIGRIMGGDREGEAKGTAAGEGVGKAIGGVAGAAAGGALLPFLGPFGPMIGAAIGDFLGGFIGSKIGPIIQPIFEPIARAFGMMKDIFLAPLMPVLEPMKELLGTFFKALGNIVGTIMKAIIPITKFVGFVLGGAIKTVFKVLSFTFNLIKNIVAFTLNPIGFAWDVIRRKDPGRDIELDQVANAKGSEKKPDLEQFDQGGEFRGRSQTPKFDKNRDRATFTPAPTQQDTKPKISSKNRLTPSPLMGLALAVDVLGKGLVAAITGGIALFGIFAPNVKKILGPQLSVVSQIFGGGASASSGGSGGVKAIPVPQVDLMAEERKKPQSDLSTTIKMIGVGKNSLIGILQRAVDTMDTDEDTEEMAVGGLLMGAAIGIGSFVKKMVTKKKRSSRTGMGESPSIGMYRRMDQKIQRKKEIQGYSQGGLLSTNGAVADVKLTPQTPFSDYALHHNKSDSHSYNNNRLGGHPIVPRDYVAVRDWNRPGLDRGTPVVAGVTGKVVYAGGDSHNTVVIANHGKDRMQFHHFDSIKTSVGSMVGPKSVIGLQGNKPSGSVHIHLDASPSDHRSFAAAQLGAEVEGDTDGDMPQTQEFRGQTPQPKMQGANPAAIPAADAVPTGESVPTAGSSVKDLITKVVNIFSRFKRKPKKEDVPIQSSIDKYQQLENRNEADRQMMIDGAKAEEALEQTDTPVCLPISMPIAINSGGGGGQTYKKVTQPLTPGILRR